MLKINCRGPKQKTRELIGRLLKYLVMKKNGGFDQGVSNATDQKQVNYLATFKYTIVRIYQ